MKVTLREDWKKAKVGDIVRGYQKGIHKVVAITDGCGCGSCFHLVAVLDSTYRKTNARKSTCDGAYIELLTKNQLIKTVEDYTREALENVKNLI